MGSSENEGAAEMVRAYDRESIPLYLVIPGDPAKPVIILPQVITQNTVLKALEKAKG